MSINPRVDRLPPDLVEGFLHVDPATVGHFIHFGFVDSGIKPLWRPVKMAGPAFTVRTPAMDTTMLHRCFEYVKPGDVLVIDRCGDMVHAGFGGVVAFAAMVQKVAGVVIDGLATDIREIEEYRLPVFARGLTALTTKMWGMGGAINPEREDAKRGLPHGPVGEPAADRRRSSRRGAQDPLSGVSAAGRAAREGPRHG